jgi:hypothetical protein
VNALKLVPTKRPDLKSQKLVALGEVPWREVLSRSPAEPGISRLNSLYDGRYSAGGWPDPVPTQVLDAIGCKTILAVTRRDVGDGGFAYDLGREFGATEADLSAMYDRKRADSVPAASLALASGVWCSNWDGPAVRDQDELARQSYSAPLLSRAPRFASYAGTISPDGQDIPGCTAAKAR